MEFMDFKLGEVVFEEDSASNCAYLVEEGKFDVFRICNVQKQVIGIFKEKDTFGKTRLIDGQPRYATVKPLRNAKCL
jgi:CRP-like cAMP-binding protein